MQKALYLNMLWAQPACKTIRSLKSLFAKKAYITSTLLYAEQKKQKLVKIRVGKKSLKKILQDASHQNAWKAEPRKDKKWYIKRLLKKKTTARKTLTKSNQKLVEYFSFPFYIQNVRLTKKTRKRTVSYIQELNKLLKIEIIHYQQSSRKILSMDHHRKIQTNKKINWSKLWKNGLFKKQIYSPKTLQLVYR